MTNQLDISSGLTTPLNIPLAEKARPERLEDILGQDSLLGAGSPLYDMIESDNFSSFILWGQPGTGKTTIARLIEKETLHNFCSFSAVLSKIAEIRQLMQRAEFLLKTENKKTIVFIDEIHRFNKSQQDGFLPFVESGAIILIGATTENPSFEVIPPLLSRCQVFILEQLKHHHIEKILARALTFLHDSYHFEPKVLAYIAERSGGDGRRAINSLEMICRRAPKHSPVTLDFVKQSLTSRSLFYDKRGEEHYNLISALHKSIRGSDPQAALYWLARMLESGENPLYIVRRLVRLASEDIGLADPQALVQAIAVKNAVEFLGMPEADTALTQLTIYLATSPKSNGCEVAYHGARDDALRSGHLQVPLHIRNAPTKLMKEKGYSKGYKYAHNYENNYAYQNYFPEDLGEKTYYTPSTFGFEKEIQKRLDWWEKLRKKS